MNYKSDSDYKEYWLRMKDYLRIFMEHGDKESADKASAYYSMMQSIEEGQEPQIIDKTDE